MSARFSVACRDTGLHLHSDRMTRGSISCSRDDTRTIESKMPLPIPTAQPTAYETAFGVLNPDPGTLERERRAVQRHPFRFVQRIAAYDGQDSLDQLRFFPVQCHDISRRGVAFLLPGRLDFDRLVVELGSDGERMYFEAETVNFRYLSDGSVAEFGDVLSDMGSIGSAPRTVLIGCRFKSKLDFLPA